MAQIKVFRFNALEANCIVLRRDGRDDCIVIDPGMYTDDEASALKAYLSGNNLTPAAILLTHGHFDHIFGVHYFPGVRVCMHPADKAVVKGSEEYIPRKRREAGDFRFPTVDIEDGEILDIAGLRLRVIHTPGHTPGGVCYYLEDDNLLIAGDTLFAGSIGRTDLPGGDYDALMDSLLRKVLALPGDTDVLPGHGMMTNIAREAMTNPFLQPFNEPDGAPDEGLLIDGLL